ncbi:MAG: alpha/beta fold hydrolase [Planctomycetes bacterium]|nr:alpha/beta fold hydrolase [Planctomycetota bacterium]
MTRPSPLLLLVTLTLLAPSGLAQRNDLAQRLIKLEQGWSNHEVTARVRALPSVEAAVASFFGFRLQRAARQLDEGRLLLRSAEIDPESAWAASRRIVLGRRIVDPRAGESLTWHEEALYDAGARPEALEIDFRFETVDGKAALPQRIERVRPEDADSPLRLVVAETAPAMDLDLVATLRIGKHALDRFVHAVALIPDLEDRLAALAEVAAAMDGPDWRRTSIEAGLAALRRLHDGDLPENEPRPLARLRALETLAALKADDALPAGEYVLALPRESGIDTIRIAVPEKVGPSSPLLLLLHGAGGSENMFFEAYGRGRYVAEGIARGAVVVAPRLPILGRLDLAGLLDRLAGIRPFARDQVFLVGHSMGAGAALDAAARSPEPLAAVVAIAGAARTSQLERLTRGPLFLGTAERDFSRRSVLDLAARLADLDGPAPVLEIAPQSEHLMVVQDLLPTVMAFLDEQGLGRPKAR